MNDPDRVAQHLAALIDDGGAELGALLREATLDACTLDEPWPEARLAYAGAAHWTIVVHRELAGLLYETARAISCVVPPPGSSSDGWEHLDETAVGLANLLWWLRVTGSATRTEVKTDDRQNGIALHMADVATRFVVAHELGHFVCRRIGRDEIAARLPEVAPEDAPHGEELLADMLGLAYHLQAFPVAAGVAIEQAAYAAAELVPRLFQLMERVGIPMSAEHPTASVRLRYFRGWALPLAVTRALRRQPRSTFVVPQIGRLAGTTERIFDRALAVIEAAAADPLEERADDAPLRERVRAEVDEASGPPEPIFVLPKFTWHIRQLGPPLDVARAAARILTENVELQHTAKARYTNDEIRRLARQQQLLLWAVHASLGPHDRLRFLMALPSSLTQENPWTSIPT